MERNIHKIGKELFITSDEKPKQGDWCIDLKDNHIFQMKVIPLFLEESKIKKIILTTDIDLIKDGVQPIPDEFLEWFCKNSSCKKVEVNDWLDDKGNIAFNNKLRYRIIIPKEEPKQELEEEVECNNCGNIMSLTEDESIYVCYNSECTNYYEEEFTEQCKDCNKSLEKCTCIEDTVDMKIETLEVIIEQIQNECHSFVESVLNVTYPNVTYQDATNTFLFMKLAELTLKLRKYEK